MAHQLTRRELLTATAGVAVMAGCGVEQRAIAPSRVSIVKAPAYDQSIYDVMRRLLAEHLGDVRGRNILLKPNLVEFEPGSSINTHPMLVHAACEAFRAMGAATVRIAEGPGHRRNTLDLAEAAGYFQIVPDFEDRFIDLNLDEVTRVRPTAQFSRIKKLYLPNSALGRGPAGLDAEDEDPSLGGRDALHEEPVRRGAQRHLRLAEERAALGGN